MEQEIVLQMEGIDKSFGNVKVLNDVSFELRKGTLHALMGENGAGKSTLMKILNGIYKKDTGRILLKGKEVTISNPKMAQDLGIAMIHQELTSLPDLSVAANIFLGREYLKGPGRIFVDKKEMCRQAGIALAEIKAPIDPKANIRFLSVAQAQLVEIAKAISCEADIIVMDEPTSAITSSEVENLFETIKTLKEQGKAIIYISHKMDEIFRIADEITVLRDGQKIDTRPASELNQDMLVSMMVGRELNQQFYKSQVSIGETVLQVNKFVKEGKFKDISFELKKGEILGIAGLMGAGRTEVAEAIFGIHPPDSGDIHLNGKKYLFKAPKEAIQQGLAFVTEDRKLTGLNLVADIKENITIANLKKYCRAGQFIKKGKEKKVAEEYIKKLSIKTPSCTKLTGQLSGGNQQKVVLARWLSCNPQIMILDEPTRGIDVAAKSEIYRLMSEYVAEGNSIIMISSELPEILGMCDRVLVMHEGEITGTFLRDEVTQEGIMACAAGIRRKDISIDNTERRQYETE